MELEVRGGGEKEGGETVQGLVGPDQGWVFTQSDMGSRGRVWSREGVRSEF